MKKEAIEIRKNELGKWMALELNPDGFWEGRLSSSALAVAVAVTALCFDGFKKNHREIEKGIEWLKRHINTDGSFGDTPASPGNVSTSLLVYASLNLVDQHKIEVASFQSRIADYLLRHSIDINTPQFSKAVLQYYQKDYTFSVPILTMCGLCGIPGKEAFRYIPQLPFELSLLPRGFYRLLNLNVVSYAIPALVAVGIVVFKKKDSGIFWRIIRRFSIQRALRILHRMLPESGGYLEAIPLTAFVALSLINSGYPETDIVKRNILFLKNTQREDGSWPIDVNLSTWVTSLTVKAFRSTLNGFLNADQQERIANHLKLIQNKKKHPFNGTPPGGWGWTHFPGSVPDGDDTPGAILALLRLHSTQTVKEEVIKGCNWIRMLQNRDGGFPTFSRGWGKLPFDRSCSDLTGHNLLAVSTVLDFYGDSLKRKEIKKFKTLFDRALKFMEEHQQRNGSWLPLWFGNQFTKEKKNPVYGTARVLTYLKDTAGHTWFSEGIKQRLNQLIKNGELFMISVQNPDGSWGGNANIPGTLEETALAVASLASEKNREICLSGFKWLDRAYREDGLQSAPIGLYFALLWYEEKWYPPTAWLEALCRFQEIR